MNTPSEPRVRIDFNDFAEGYDEALNRGLSLSGEDKEFFATRRLEWLERCLGVTRVERMLDFGCGTGAGSVLLHRIFGEPKVVALDTSTAAIEVAARRGAEGIEFTHLSQYHPAADIDVAYCSSVFHHIPPPDRPASLRYVRDCLRPGGLFAFWENNPWNPGTQLVMSRIPFDRDAIKVSVLEARRLLVAAGFELVASSFLFYFPNALRALRPFERYLTRVPLGAQYQVLCRKPS